MPVAGGTLRGPFRKTGMLMLRNHDWGYRLTSKNRRTGRTAPAMAAYTCGWKKASAAYNRAGPIRPLCHSQTSHPTEFPAR